jgi:hypothetical protein
MMYLSSALKPGAHLRTIMAHEYMHAVVYARKSRARKSCRNSVIEEEGWLDEAMAHLAEDLHGFSTTNIDYRVSAFLNQPERYQLVVDDYYAADLFRSHGNRGSTYLFLRWCADCFGPALLPSLASSDLRGIANLEAATGATFAALFRRWSVNLYESGRSGSDSSRNQQPTRVEVRRRAPHDSGDEWKLAGPRFARVAPGSPACEWLALGTTAHYVVIDGANSPYAEIEVSGPREAELQVTAMPLGADLAKLDLDVQKVPGAAGLSLRVHLRERNGFPVQLSALSWEPQAPSGSSARSASSSGRLDPRELAAVFGDNQIPGHGEMVSRPISLPAGAVGGGNGPLIVKVMGTDAAGRRVVAWAQVDLAPADRGNEL